VRAAAVTWLIGFGLYLLFAGQVSGPECAAGAIMTSVAAGLVIFLNRRGHVSMRARAPWGRLAARLGKAVVVDAARVGAAFVRGLYGHNVRGVIMKQPFEIGPVAPEANARRGLVILLGSLAPNGFVLEVQRKPGALLLHRLAPAPRSEDVEWPV
jgi:hypothetical protein